MRGKRKSYATAESMDLALEGKKEMGRTCVLTKKRERKSKTAQNKATRV